MQGCPDDTSVNGSIDPETDEDGPPWDPDAGFPDEAEDEDEDEPDLDL